MFARKTYDYDAAAGQPYVSPRAGDDDFGGEEFLLTLLVSPLLVAWWACKHWPVTAPLAALGATWAAAGPAAAGVLAGAGVTVAVVWALLHRSSFVRVVVEPYRRRVRRRAYRRAWVEAMHNAGLSRGFGSERVAPRIVKMRLGQYCDRLLVQLLVGQGADELRTAIPALADTFGAQHAAVLPEPSKPGRGRKAGQVWVNLTLADRLAVAVPAIPPTDPVDLGKLTIGLREDAHPWNVSLSGGSHLLIGGATGSGKSSVLWSLLAAAGPMIRSGLVQVWAADPKGGMELALGQDLFTRFTYGPDMVTMVLDAEQLITTRAAAYRGHSRSHTPTVAEPHILIMLDELAGLTAYNDDRDAVKAFNRALPRVLSQGRAVGMTVVGALQDPRKDVLESRSLFTTGVALRTRESREVGMILTDGAHARGAACEHIPVETPGVGYVETTTDPVPARVRASYYDDDAVRALAEKYRPRPATTDPGNGDGDVIVGEILGEAA